MLRVTDGESLGWAGPGLEESHVPVELDSNVDFSCLGLEHQGPGSAGDALQGS